MTWAAVGLWSSFL